VVDEYTQLRLYTKKMMIEKLRRFVSFFQDCKIKERLKCIRPHREKGELRLSESALCRNTAFKMNYVSVY
jgi:hypothetical protein